MSNIHCISLVHIITSITIHLHLPRRYLGTIHQCHVRLAASIPHPCLYSAFRVQAFPFVPFSLLFAVSLIVNIWFELSFLQLLVRFWARFLSIFKCVDT